MRKGDVVIWTGRPKVIRLGGGGFWDGWHPTDDDVVGIGIIKESVTGRNSVIEMGKNYTPPAGGGRWYYSDNQLEVIDHIKEEE